VTRSAPLSRIGVLVTAVALAAGVAGCGVLGSGSGQKTLTADFTRTVGLYESSDVRILGVPIGKVSKIEPNGTTVKVTMTYDGKYKIPADAKAVIVAPSIVSDRYVQLTPVYTSGAVMADNKTLPVTDTLVPVELDQIFASLNKLNLALGPKGANKDGALNDLLGVSAKNLKGNGELLNSTLKNFSQLVSTLNGSRDDLFGTVRNLQKFTTTIAQSDTTVREFNRELAGAANQLAGQRTDLATAVKQLSIALGEVASFVKENKQALTANVTDLANVTTVISKNRKALEEFTDTAPGALSNLQLAYNSKAGTLDTREDSAGSLLGSPLAALCPQLSAAGGQAAAACQQLSQTLGGLIPSGGAPPPALPPAPGLPGLPGVPSAALKGAAPAPSSTPDLTLNGLLGGGR